MYNIGEAGLFVDLGNILGSICGTPEMLEGRFSGSQKV